MIVNWLSYYKHNYKVNILQTQLTSKELYYYKHDYKVNVLLQTQLTSKMLYYYTHGYKVNYYYSKHNYKVNIWLPKWLHNKCCIQARQNFSTCKRLLFMLKPIAHDTLALLTFQEEPPKRKDKCHTVKYWSRPVNMVWH